MIPLIITACPRCGNADVSEFHNGGDHVTCGRCGDVRPVKTKEDGTATLYGEPVRDDAWARL